MDRLVELPPHRRDIEIRSASFEEASNSIEVIWTTGAKVRRYSYREEAHYDEELVVDASSVRLDRLNGGAPFLDTHDDWSLASIIGTVMPGTAEIRNGKGYARVKLSVAPEHAGVVANIKAGVIRNISVGYRIHRVEKTEGDDGEVAVWRVIDWEPLEISAVAVPADAGSSIRANRSDDDKDRLAPCMFVGEPDDDQAREAATRAERQRASTIRSLAATANAPDLGRVHEEQGTSVGQFRSILLDHLVTAEAPPLRSMTGAVAERSVVDSRRADAIQNAIMHRISPTTVDLTPDARDFRGLTILEIGRDLLEANGVSTRGMSKQELARAVLIQRRTGGLHSTSDFPGILGNVVNASLRAAYAAEAQTFRPLVRETSAVDFKPITRVQMGEAPILNKVNEHGEFKRGTLGEGKEVYRLATYGKIVGITRQVIINDDLDAFSRLPSEFGKQAARLESDLVWGEILGNPVMGDGKTLFHADHGNIILAGSISVAGMSRGRVLFAKQTGLDGRTVLGLVPAYLIVPIELQTLAEQFISQVYPATISDAVPEKLKRVQLIVEPRVSSGINRPEDDLVVSGSSTSWYLAGSAAQGEVVELAYLEGNRGVYTETRTGFDVDGVEVKARLDVAAKAMDWRNVAKNAGV